MHSQQNKSQKDPKIKRIAGVEVRTRKELLYVLSSITVLFLATMVFIFTIIRIYFLYAQIKSIKQENQFLAKQLKLLDSVDETALAYQLKQTEAALPKDINLSSLANTLNIQARRYALDIIQLAVTEEVTVQEERLGDKRINKRYTVKKVYIPIQLKGDLESHIRFLEYIRTDASNLWFDEVRISQTQQTNETGAPVYSWNMRLQLMQVVFPHVKITGKDAIKLITQLQLESLNNITQ